MLVSAAVGIMFVDLVRAFKTDVHACSRLHDSERRTATCAAVAWYLPPPSSGMAR